MVIGGDYDLQEVKGTEDVDYICFTDRGSIDSNGWTLKQVPLILPKDPFRSSRDFKIRPHRWLSGYYRSIYVDSSVKILIDPRDVWSILMPSPSVVFGALNHSYRGTLVDEFAAVLKGRLDYPETLREQKLHYQEVAGPSMLEKPVWGGFLARRHHNEACVEAMEVWFCNVMRYSRRDQLSLPTALDVLAPHEKNILADDIRKSEFHSWPNSNKPKPAGYTVRGKSRFARLKDYFRRYGL